MTNMESVYGRIVRAKRASKFYQPIVQYVHEGDVFKFGPDTETGLTKIFEHTTSLENLDKRIVAAYTYVTDNDGNTDVFIMTEKEWLTSWKKSPNGASVAKEFQRDMIFRTIIKKATKSLVNADTPSFAQMDDDDDSPLADNKAPEVVDLDSSDYQEFVEEEAKAEPVEATTNVEESSLVDESF
jgi:recombinational DNA repair protein RecT